MESNEVAVADSIIVIKKPEITLKEIVTSNLNANQNLKHMHFVSAYS